MVLFEMYGGIENGRYSSNRIAATNTRCDRNTVINYEATQPSPSVFSDANN